MRKHPNAQDINSSWPACQQVDNVNAEQRASRKKLPGWCQHGPLGTQNGHSPVLEIYRQARMCTLVWILWQYCSSLPSACRLYLTVLKLCLFCDYRNCGTTQQANHSFPDFSLTNVKLPEFSRFSMWVATLAKVQKNLFFKKPQPGGFGGFNWVLGFIGFFGCTVAEAVK